MSQDERIDFVELLLLKGWLTEDHKLVLMDDEKDENMKPFDEQFMKTYIWDVVDLENPQMVDVHESSLRCIDHNQYIIGNLTYQANYESGLRILSIDRASNTLNEVAYFDVLPSRTTAEFAGAWSVYPYYPSGNVVVSSIDYGLFVLRPNMAAIQEQIQSQKAYAERTRTRQILHRPEGAQCPAVRETESCDAELTC